MKISGRIVGVKGIMPDLATDTHKKIQRLGRFWLIAIGAITVLWFLDFTVSNQKPTFGHWDIVFEILIVGFFILLLLISVFEPQKEKHGEEPKKIPKRSATRR